MLRNRARIVTGQLVAASDVQSRLILETGEEYRTGRIVSPGIIVSPTTGTVPTAAAFRQPRPCHPARPVLRLELTIGTTRAVLVPQRATSRASDGR